MHDFSTSRGLPGSRSPFAASAPPLLEPRWRDGSPFLSARALSECARVCVSSKTLGYIGRRRDGRRNHAHTEESPQARWDVGATPKSIATSVAALLLAALLLSIALLPALLLLAVALLSALLLAALLLAALLAALVLRDVIPARAGGARLVRVRVRVRVRVGRVGRVGVGVGVEVGVGVGVWVGSTGRRCSPACPRPACRRPAPGSCSPA